ncbi:MAG: efflux RND transporter periplasmic adaptor subunit [bacterium]
MKFITKHKFLTTIILLALIGGGYYTYTKIAANYAPNTYTMTRVTRGEIASVISGSGQIYSSQQIDIKSKASGELASVNVTQGQKVKAGQIIATLDKTSASMDLAKARLAFSSAQINYNKSIKRATDDEITAADLNVENAQLSLSNTFQDVTNTINNDYTKIDNLLRRQIDGVFTDPENKPGLSVLTTDQQSEIYAESGRAKSTVELNAWKQELSSLSINSVSEATTAINKVRAHLLVIKDFLNNTATALISAITTSGVSQSTINSYRNSIDSARSSIDSLLSDMTQASQQISNAQSSVTSAQTSLTQKLAPISDEDLAVAKANLENARLSFQSAEMNYQNYTITAPFAGIIGTLTAKKGDSVSGSAIGTLITEEYYAQISLNEVDMAKIKIGNPVDLTFDALPDAKIQGTVSQIDSVGTVSQGVVTYNVRISFNNQDQQIKSGMSVSATITISNTSDVLRLPSGVIKSAGRGKYYVEILSSTSSTPTLSNNKGTSTMPRFNGQGFNNQIITRETPIRKAVEIGATNGVMTEIISGLSDGDSVISKTISGSTTSNNSVTGAPTSGSNRAATGTNFNRSGTGALGGLMPHGN